MYSQEDLTKAKAIQFMTNEMGLNLQGVKCLLYMAEYHSVEKLMDSLEMMCAGIGLTPLEMQKNKQCLKNRGRRKRIDGGK